MSRIGRRTARCATPSCSWSQSFWRPSAWCATHSSSAWHLTRPRPTSSLPCCPGCALHVAAFKVWLLGDMKYIVVGDLIYSLGLLMLMLSFAAISIATIDPVLLSGKGTHLQSHEGSMRNKPCRDRLIDSQQATSITYPEMYSSQHAFCAELLSSTSWVDPRQQNMTCALVNSCRSFENDVLKPVRATPRSWFRPNLRIIRSTTYLAIQRGKAYDIRRPSSIEGS